MTKSFWKGVVLVSTFALTSLCFAEYDLSRTLTPQVSVTGQMDILKFQQLMQQGFSE